MSDNRADADESICNHKALHYGATVTHLYVSSPLLSLVRHPLLDAGQFLLQIGHLVLVELRQVVQLVFQTLISEGRCGKMHRY